MNISLRMIIVLTVVSLFAGISLVFVNQYAAPLIKQNAEKAIEKAVFTVLPDAKKTDKITFGETTIFKGINEENQPVGYAFLAEGSGYQGVIKIMVGIDSKLEKLTGIEILESVETPGLGAKIAKPHFKDQFKGVSVSPIINYVKGRKPTRPNEIQAITGATISSRSVVKILNTNIKKIKENLKEEKSESGGENE